MVVGELVRGQNDYTKIVIVPPAPGAAVGTPTATTYHPTPTISLAGRPLYAPYHVVVGELVRGQNETLSIIERVVYYD